jgi:hypothetical protein
MRVLWTVTGILAATPLMSCGLFSCGFAQTVQPAQPSIPAGQLVREVVFNELNDHQNHGYWRYWIERHTAKETRREEQIETADGPVSLLTLTDGRPVSVEVQQEEQSRLQHLLTSPTDQARHLQEYEEDEQRIGRVLTLLPDAFLYTYTGPENGCITLIFKPNPDYPAHSIEARIFHAMGGELWVDARMKRLVRLDAHVQDNLDFGYGLLGRLYKGGWFQIERSQVSANDWKTARLEVHIMGRALVKSFARETSEVRGGFAPVPSGMNLAQGMAMLQQTEARKSATTKPALITPAELALRR